MTVLDMYKEFRNEFPEVTQKADVEHIQLWDEVNPDFAHAWFESLAGAINVEMTNDVPADRYLPIFEFLRKKYHIGNDVVSSCIDISFVENLFWRVSTRKAQPYWAALPNVFKELYVDFHTSTPV